MQAHEVLFQLFDHGVLHFDGSDLDCIKLTPMTQEHANLIRDLADAGIGFDCRDARDHHLDFTSQILQAHIGNDIIFELEEETAKDVVGTIFSDFPSFIANTQRQCREPSKYCILGEKYSTDGEATGLVAHYKNVISLIQLLSSIADFDSDDDESSHDKSLTYLHRSKLTMSISYGEDELQEQLDGLSIVKEIFTDEQHQEQKKSIAKEVLVSLLVNIPDNKKFKYLLQNFNVFSVRFNENYQLYVSEFSFDEVRSEFEERKREYFVKINDVFTSVQGKLLGVPISIAAASVKVTTITGNQSFAYFIGFAILTYAILLWLIIKNQKHTLSALKSEYESLMGRLKRQFPDQYSEIEGLQVELQKRYNYQRYCLKIFSFMCIALVVLALYMFIGELLLAYVIKYLYQI